MNDFTNLNSIARRVMRLSETTQVVGACDMTLRRWEESGTFPRRFKLSPDSGKFGAVGHDFHEVMEYMEYRRASRSTEAAVGDAP